ncbi:hypothetical protein D3C71_1192580 [compost metagenome]
MSKPRGVGNYRRGPLVVSGTRAVMGAGVLEFRNISTDTKPGRKGAFGREGKVRPRGRRRSPAERGPWQAPRQLSTRVFHALLDDSYETGNLHTQLNLVTQDRGIRRIR